MISYVPHARVGKQGTAMSASTLREAAALKRVNHLWTAAHAVSKVPNLARALLCSMDLQATASDITLTEAVTTRFCDHCHALLLPGETATSRLVAKRRQARMKITLDTAPVDEVDAETAEGGGIAAPKEKGAGTSSRRRNWRVRRRYKNCTKLVTLCHACGHGNSLATSERPRAKAPKAAVDTVEAEETPKVSPEPVKEKATKDDTPKPSSAPRRFSFSGEAEVGSDLLSGAQRLAQASAKGVVTPISKLSTENEKSSGESKSGGKRRFDNSKSKSKDTGSETKKKKKKTRKSGSGDDLLKGLQGSSEKKAGSSLASFLGSL